ncbi:MAG: 1,4-dihydroxy-2-naphthoate polyprenyltransferase [Proteobacteria bacterium]|nr:1,4-dihydroxy-2-naphthoate polyprenyltransferase [Pseudomonadota bacterium]
MSVRPWIAAARPKTLTAAVVPVVVGSVLGWRIAADTFSLSVAILALLSAAAIQVGTNLFNDVLDFERGADTRDRIGPARITLTGQASPATVYRRAWACFGVALCAGVFLVAHGGWPILLIGILSLLFGYCYTGGPFPLAYNGLGELFVLVFFGVVAVAGTVYLHAGVCDWSALLAGVQVGLLASTLLAINNLRDRSTDLPVGKRTLAVLLGEHRTRIMVSFFVLTPFALGILWCFVGARWAFCLPLVVLPRATSLCRAVLSDKPGVILNQRLASAALLHLLFGGLLAMGLGLP